MRRARVSIWVIGVLSFAFTWGALAAPPPPKLPAQTIEQLSRALQDVSSLPELRHLQVMKTPIARIFFEENQKGRDFMSELTGRSPDLPADFQFDAFVQKLSWSGYKPLGRRLSREVVETEAGLRARWKERGEAHDRPIQDELLSDEDLAFIRAQAEARLNQASVQRLLTDVREQAALVLPYREKQKKLLEIFPSDGEVPKLPHEMVGDPKDLQLKWYQKIVLRFKAYKGFFSSLKIPIRKNYSKGDLAIVRKYNRLLDALNEYAQMRLIMKSFTNERASIYLRLNKLTVETSEDYVRASLTAENYVEARRAVAADLELNDIVFEAEKRMLKIVESCRVLGGGKLGPQVFEGKIRILETNIAHFRNTIHRIEVDLARTEKEIAELRNKIDEAEDAETESKLIAELNQKLFWKNRATGELGISKQRLDVSAQDLEKLYTDFVTNYEMIELFKDLPIGRISGEKVQTFDLPEPFMVRRDELRVWDEIYQRAMDGSMTGLVKGELKLFVSTRLGNTRRFIREMNQLTSKYFGQKFTETTYGVEFKKFEQSLVMNMVSKGFSALKIAAPPSIVAALVKYHEQMWEWVFGKSEGGEGGTETTDDSDGSQDNSKSDDTSGAGGGSSDPSSKHKGDDATDPDEGEAPDVDASGNLRSTTP